MTCRCINNTLPQFIRSVAQIDIFGFATTSSIRRELCRSTANIRRHRAVQHQHSSQRRFNSTLPSSSDTEPQTLQRKSSQSDDGGGTRDGRYKFESVIAEVSPESIDALASEPMSITEFEVQVPERSIRPKVGKFENATEVVRNSSIRPRSQTPSNTIFQSTGFATDSISEQQSPSFVVRRTSFMHSGKSEALPDSSQETFQFPRSLKRDASKTPEDNGVPLRREPWQVHKAAMKEKFPEGWNPLKRLSPDAMAGIKALHQQMPEKYTTWVLAEHFKVSPEAIRRILKSKWQPDADVQADREARWFRRGERVWGRYAELGVKPPRKWRDEGIGRGKPEWLKRKQEPRVIPALITTARREGGVRDNSGEVTNSQRPQLVTTARPTEDH